MTHYYDKMVKNLTGGNKSKRFSSKSSGSTMGRVRKAVEAGEVYAVVDKMCGGDNCMVQTKQHKEPCRCIIRGKFRGRNKSYNTIKPGVWVLIGMRDWESSTKTKCCDLLEVYTQHDIDVLKQTENRDILPIFSHDEDDDGLFDREVEKCESLIEEDVGEVDESTYTFDNISFDDI